MVDWGRSEEPLFPIENCFPSIYLKKSGREGVSSRLVELWEHQKEKEKKKRRPKKERIIDVEESRGARIDPMQALMLRFAPLGTDETLEAVQRKCRR